MVRAVRLPAPRQHWPLLLVLAACGPQNHPDPPRQNTIADFRASAGVEFVECGTLVYAPWSRACPDGYATTVACAFDALASCVPSHVLIDRFTLQGSATVDHLFLLPGDAGCSVVSFTDERDANDCPYYARRSCDGLQAQQAQCGAVAPTGCSEPVALGKGDCTDAE